MTDITCDGCYHSTTKGEHSEDKECSLCIRNSSNLSRRDLEREIEINGVKFKAPLDMYIAKDRMKFEDYMRTKQIFEAIEKANLRKDEYPKPELPIIWPQPNPYYPYDPNHNWWVKKIKYTENLVK